MKASGPRRLVFIGSSIVLAIILAPAGLQAAPAKPRVLIYDHSAPKNPPEVVTYDKIPEDISDTPVLSLVDPATGHQKDAEDVPPGAKVRAQDITLEKQRAASNHSAENSENENSDDENFENEDQASDADTNEANSE